MRFLLTSWGSFGDLHPFLALGRGLLARGHQVTLLGHPDWEAEATAAGLRFVSSGEPGRKELIREHPDVLSPKWGGLTSLHALAREAIAPSYEPMLEALLRETPTHDAMVAHHFTFPAPGAAELTGIPWATVTLAPGIIPSAYTQPAASYRLSGEGVMARQWNRFVWSTGRLLTRRAVDPIVNAGRARRGLRPVKDVIFAGHSPRLNLQLYSKHYAQRPPDWTEEKRYAGFCFYDPPHAPGLAPEVEDFLQRGDKPVLFTLGSTAVQQPGAFYRSAVEALGSLGLRGILLIGPEENRPRALPDQILAVPYVSYGLLMPRVRAVAHQCGIGTLSHTLRAGVPSVACPFAFDQPSNARRLEALGVGEVVLPHQHTARHLREALQRLLAGEAPERARRLGEIIRAEDGVGQACAILEETFSSGVERPAAPAPTL